MCKSISYTTITLLPKVKQPITARDYTLIACCSILGKTVSNVFENRLKTVLPNIICNSQPTFISGRQIGDNIPLAFELRANISPRCVFKVDLREVYDSVEWAYLREVVLRLGFPIRLVKWVPGVNFYPRCKKFDLTDLIFADDLLLFARGDLILAHPLFNNF
ncbi:hypothetical protein Cgig2_011176 [Carnegiea gigantea]|uniref:Reverse transcriptase domain-containing protein n=1 Tax=Carnegiea gigantea TaxID=171969 RepID=A0A9Q1GNF6_9CARY|nr:hypothetical protein Cgig2_011176 [Carnegiea gigantea]